MTPQARTTIDELLEHADWVQNLARRLVLDGASADDLVQQTWLVALEKKPPVVANARAWLGSVLTNVARSQWRSKSRAKERERATARPEALPSTAELVQEAESSTELVQRVLQLEERYRTVLLLRYFRGRAPTQIAIELGRPVPTVRTWLQRGIAELHGQLDREYGSRESWCLAFLPLAQGAGKNKALAAAPAIAAAALLAGLSVAAWWPQPVGQPAARPLQQASTRSARVAASTLPAAVKLTRPAPHPPQRTAATRDPDGPQAPPPALSLQGLKGRVMDWQGVPVAGLELAWRDPGALRWADEARTILSGKDTWLKVTRAKQDELRADPEALVAWTQRYCARPALAEALIQGIAPPSLTTKTTGQGGYDLQVPSAFGSLHSLDPNWALWASAQPAGAGTPTYWLAAQRRDVRGTLLDERGDPCPGATVELVPSMPVAPPAVLAEAGKLRVQSLRVETDASGGFLFAGAPQAFSYKLVARRGADERAHAEIATPVNSLGTTTLNVHLRLSGPIATVPVTGRVYLPGGEPSPRTHVACGGVSTLTNENGDYSLDVPAHDLTRPFLAARSGWGIAEQPSFLAGTVAGSTSVRGPDLWLQDAVLFIEGRVVDAAGVPVPGARVSLANPATTQHHRSLEDIASGREHSHVETGPNGRFTLDGLRQRDYVLIARQGRRQTRSNALPAGRAGVELRLSGGS